MAKHFLCFEGFRQQLAATYTLVHVLQHRAEVRITLPLDQQLQRLDDRQAGVNQGHELLVENDELVLLDFAPLRQAQVGRQQPFRFHRIDEETLLREAVANLGLRGPVLQLLENCALARRPS